MSFEQRRNDLVIMSERGQIMRIRSDDISQVGRNTMGVTIMELEEGDAVASVTVVPAVGSPEAPDGVETTADDGQ